MVRDMKDGDEQALRLIHTAGGFDYQFPDLRNPLFLVRKVLESDGMVVGGLVLRLNLEAFLLVGDADPQEKLNRVTALQSEALKDAYSRGFDDVYAVIPGEAFKNRRLRKLGWTKDRPNWSLWSRSTLESSDAVGSQSGKLGI